MWSISMSLARVQEAPSYGLFQVPDSAVQAELTTTLSPSRFSTNSLRQASVSSLPRDGATRRVVPGVASAADGGPVRKLLATVASSATRNGNLEAGQQCPGGGRAGDTRLHIASSVKLLKVK